MGLCQVRLCQSFSLAGDSCFPHCSEPIPSLSLCQKWGQCQRPCSGSPPHPVVFLGNAKARCEPQEPGNPQVQLPADKSVHSFATSTFIYHTGFHHLILFVQQLCSGSLGMQLDCWHLVPRAAAVNVSCLVWVPSLALCSWESLFST